MTVVQELIQQSRGLLDVIREFNTTQDAHGKFLRLLEFNAHHDKRGRFAKGGVPATSWKNPMAVHVGDAVAAFREHYGAGRGLYLRWEEGKLSPGDVIRPSSVWRDGEPTKKLLLGTSTINPRFSKFSKHDLASGYMGQPYVVKGNRVRSGADPGEVILQNATVVAKLNPST